MIPDRLGYCHMSGAVPRLLGMFHSNTGLTVFSQIIPISSKRLIWSSVSFCSHFPFRVWRCSSSHFVREIIICRYFQIPMFLIILLFNGVSVLPWLWQCPLHSELFQFLEAFLLHLSGVVFFTLIVYPAAEFISIRSTV